MLPRSKLAYVVLYTSFFALISHFTWAHAIASAKKDAGAPSKKTRKTGLNTLVPVLVEHLTTHERHYLRPDLPSGGFSLKQISAMSHLMRCHHTGKEKRIHASLISLLYQIAKHFNHAQLWIIAGYRAPEIARAKGNPRSPHQKGIASDIRVTGVSIEALRDYLRSNYHSIGVGYYPNAGFIHVDVERTYDAYWIDASAPGQQARYLRGCLKSPLQRGPNCYDVPECARSERGSCSRATATMQARTKAGNIIAVAATVRGLFKHPLNPHLRGKVLQAILINHPKAHLRRKPNGALALHGVPPPRTHGGKG